APPGLIYRPRRCRKPYTFRQCWLLEQWRRPFSDLSRNAQRQGGPDSSPRHWTRPISSMLPKVRTPAKRRLTATSARPNSQRSFEFLPLPSEEQEEPKVSHRTCPSG